MNIVPGGDGALGRRLGACILMYTGWWISFRNFVDVAFRKLGVYTLMYTSWRILFMNVVPGAAGVSLRGVFTPWFTPAGGFCSWTSFPVVMSPCGVTVFTPWFTTAGEFCLIRLTRLKEWDIFEPMGNVVKQKWGRRWWWIPSNEVGVWFYLTRFGNIPVSCACDSEGESEAPRSYCFHGEIPVTIRSSKNLCSAFVSLWVMSHPISFLLREQAKRRREIIVKG